MTRRLEENKRLLEELRDREYREEFLSATVRAGIAYQVQVLRRQDGSTQKEFADKTGKKQTQISRLESTESGGVAVQTLVDIAAALGIGLVVRFVDLAEMLERTEDMSDAALQAKTIEQIVADAADAAEVPEAPRRAVFVSYELPSSALVKDVFSIGADLWQTQQISSTQPETVYGLNGISTSMPMTVSVEFPLSTSH